MGRKVGRTAAGGGASAGLLTGLSVEVSVSDPEPRVLGAISNHCLYHNYFGAEWQRLAVILCSRRLGPALIFSHYFAR